MACPLTLPNIRDCTVGSNINANKWLSLHSDNSLYFITSSDESPSITGRQWFVRDLDGVFTRIHLDVHEDATLNMIYAMPDHTLVIRYVTEKDCGFYVCHDNEEPPTEYKMEYPLDGNWESIMRVPPSER